MKIFLRNPKYRITSKISSPGRFSISATVPWQKFKPWYGLDLHFRNIRGGFLDFRETFIDDGDVDMLRAMRVYKEVGFDGMMMPDHVPAIVGDPKGLGVCVAAVAAES